MKLPYITVLLICLFLFSFSENILAQGDNPVIQFSGVIIDKDERPLQGVYVYVPKAGRGTSTNNVGFFELPTLPGDSIVVSAVGYKKRYFIMPNVLEKAYSVLIELKEDVITLPTVEIYPYPTEELFKQAFLAMELADEKEQAAVRRNLDQELLTRMMYENTKADPGSNYRYYMNQQNYNTANKGFYQANPLLNPFAWSNFIKSVKRGDLKNRSWKEK
jgi:hypothetical protein